MSPGYAFWIAIACILGYLATVALVIGVLGLLPLEPIWRWTLNGSFGYAALTSWAKGYKAWFASASADSEVRS